MVDTVFQDKEETMGYKHKDALLDSLLGKRVTVTFIDGDKITGLLGFDEQMEQYKLTNAINEKRGFPTHDTLFRKSHYKDVVRR